MSDGREKRPFCYITDATVAFFKLLFEGESGDAYNVSNTSQTTSIHELGEILSSTHGVDLKFKHHEDAIRSTVFSEDKTVLHVSEKLERLGFSFEVDVRTGFNRVITHFKNMEGGIT